jgi:putative membrane protein
MSFPEWRSNALVAQRDLEFSQRGATPMPDEKGQAADALTLRDHLALDRTALANERTLLAYLRSGVALLLAGVTFIQFGAEAWYLGIGLACLPSGLATTMVGVRRYRYMSEEIRRQRGAALAADQSGGASRANASRTDASISRP